MAPASLVVALASAAIAIALVTACGPPPIDAAGSAAQPLTSQCPAAAQEGIDVFDGQGAIDWPAVAASGIAFAILKATQGTYDTQSTFASNWAGARAAGLTRGAYHFFDPTEDGALQAAHFLGVVGDLAPGDIAPVVDVECPDGDESCLYDGASGDATPAAIHDRLWAFLDAVVGATGRTPILYTFGSYFASNAVDVTGLGAYPLFLAYPTSEDCLSVPVPWTEAALWQYSWTGSVGGIRGAVDRDRWIGPGLLSSASSAILSTASLSGASGSGSWSTAMRTSVLSSSGEPSHESAMASVRRPSAATASAGCAVVPSARRQPRAATTMLLAMLAVFSLRRLPRRVRAC